MTYTDFLAWQEDVKRLTGEEPEKLYLHWKSFNELFMCTPRKVIHKRASDPDRHTEMRIGDVHVVKQYVGLS